jgi:hypothetical protein
LIAENDLNETASDGDASGAYLDKILLFAGALSSFLESGQVVLHRAEVVTTGGVLPVGKLMRLKIDYSVAATITGIDVGLMSLQMQPNQPLRIRVREVILTIDPERAGVKMFQLDYTKSSLEVEDPGGWKVKGPGSLFDVLGTRSGRGSMWIEVDLRFKLDLGPVKVSGVTIRATLDAQGKLSASWRGLEASIALAPMIDGSGGVHLDDHGWSATLRATITPLNVGALANVQQTQDMVKLALGVDLPGPIPLGNTGLGIYGLGGVFAANGKPKPVPPGTDPVQHQLNWDYRENGSFVPAEAFSFGLEAVIGTAVDMGYAFSARTGIFITTPEFALRGSLNGKFMGKRVKITREDEGGTGIQAKGVIVVDPNDGVTIAIEGTYKIPEILEIIVPIGARFPKKLGRLVHPSWRRWMVTTAGRCERRSRARTGTRDPASESHRAAGGRVHHVPRQRHHELASRRRQVGGAGHVHHGVRVRLRHRDGREARGVGRSFRARGHPDLHESHDAGRPRADWWQLARRPVLGWRRRPRARVRRGREETVFLCGGMRQGRPRLRHGT